jgi:hypothetical protein
MADCASDARTDPPGQDPGLEGIALGGFQVARDLAPAGAVVAAYAVRVFQLAGSPQGAVNSEFTIPYAGPAVTKAGAAVVADQERAQALRAGRAPDQLPLGLRSLVTLSCY